MLENKHGFHWLMAEGMLCQNRPPLTQDCYTDMKTVQISKHQENAAAFVEGIMMILQSILLEYSALCYPWSKGK